MSEPAGTEVDPYTDGMVEQTDNSGEEGQPDPPQDPGWRPWADRPTAT